MSSFVVFLFHLITIFDELIGSKVLYYENWPFWDNFLQIKILE